MTPEQELEQLRLANTRLRLEAFAAQEAVKQMSGLCRQATYVAVQWKQVAIAAMAKAEALEQ